MNRMKLAIGSLAALAALQVLLVVVTHSGDAQLAMESVNGTLAEFDKQQVNQVIIRSAEDSVTLKKTADGWQTATGFPADSQKVDELLAKLAGLQHGLPVAISQDALSRFQVAEDDFERHIQLQQGDKTVLDLYLGSGAGARQSHVRPAQAQAVYSAAIGSYDAPADNSAWQDKTVLQLNEESVQSVTLNELTVAKVSKGSGSAPLWQAAALPEGKLLNQAAINAGLQPLWNLRFAEVLGKEAKPAYGLDNPGLVLKLTHAQGEREYQFAKLAGGDDFVLKVSDHEAYFRIAGHTVKPLVEKNTVANWLLTEQENPPVSPAAAVQE